MADDNFLQPQPGTSAAGHAVSGLVPLAGLALAGYGYRRGRPGLRGVIALMVGFFGVLFGTEAVHYTMAVGPSGDDYTGLLSVVAGLLLIGVGAVELWSSRRREGRLWWRYGRRFLVAAAAAVALSIVAFPLSIGYVITHAQRAEVPRPDLGTAYENVSFTTSDGLRLKGWYIRSRNHAAVIVFPGRASSQKQAKMLARHGYGVLLFDRRGEAESEGDPNIFGWHGERDVQAAVLFLQRRRDVDRQRIGGVGLSVGGEMLIAAAAESDELRAIVTEGASSRSVRDEWTNGSGWGDLLANGVATASTALFSNTLPPPDLQSLVGRIGPTAVFFVYGEHGQSTEASANKAFYTAAREPKAIWEVPGAGHAAGIDARPKQYERRVVGFFDRELLRGT